MIMAIEAAKQGIKVGEDIVSGLMFVEDLAGIFGTPEGLKKRIEKALEHTTTKWRVMANILSPYNRGSGRGVLLHKKGRLAALAVRLSSLSNGAKRYN